MLEDVFGKIGKVSLDFCAQLTSRNCTDYPSQIYKAQIMNDPHTRMYLLSFLVCRISL